LESDFDFLVSGKYFLKMIGENSMAGICSRFYFEGRVIGMHIVKCIGAQVKGYLDKVVKGIKDPDGVTLFDDVC
jgi:hypothetical protein